MCSVYKTVSVTRAGCAGRLWQSQVGRIKLCSWACCPVPRRGPCSQSAAFLFCPLLPGAGLVSHPFLGRFSCSWCPGADAWRYPKRLRQCPCLLPAQGTLRRGWAHGAVMAAAWPPRGVGNSSRMLSKGLLWFGWRSLLTNQGPVIHVSAIQLQCRDEMTEKRSGKIILKPIATDRPYTIVVWDSIGQENLAGCWW